MHRDAGLVGPALVAGHGHGDSVRLHQGSAEQLADLLYLVEGVAELGPMLVALGGWQAAILFGLVDSGPGDAHQLGSFTDIESAGDDSLGR
ncbi:hypothetical protein D3C85_1210250 [compost metagenome]